MKSAAISSPFQPPLRRSLQLLSVSAALASVGIALAQVPLFLGFAYERWATISGKELVLFAAAVVGLARLATPRIMRLAGGAKRVAIAASALGGLSLIALPFVTWPYSLFAEQAMAMHMGLFVLACLLEAVGAVAIWTWIGELTPRRVLGKYLGCRESVRLLALAPAVVAAGLLTRNWRIDRRPMSMKFWDHITPIWVGGFLVLAAALLLMYAREGRGQYDRTHERTWRVWLRPLADPQYSRLLLFAVWTSFFTALSLPAQNYFPRFELDLSRLTPFYLLAAATLGQSLVSPWMGRACDAVGSRLVVLVSQVIAAFVPFFFFMASPEQPWWIAAAFAALAAEVGVRLGLSSLMLKLAPPKDRSYCIASFLSITALAFAFGNLMGDLLLEGLSFHKFRIAGRELNDYEYLFYIGWMTQLMGAIILFGLKEPGAIAWRWKPKVMSAVTSEPIRHPLD